MKKSIKVSSFSEKQRSYYNLRAKNYDDRGVYVRENRNHYKKIQKIKEYVKKAKPQEILEVGVGTGLHAYWLLDNLNYDVRYTGIDVSENMLEIAKKRLSKYKKVKLIRANTLRLPFRKNSFDLVFCSGTLHHIEETERAIEEMVRVLKPGKKLIMIEPNWLFPTSFLIAIMNPIERNILKMKKSNFLAWTKKLINHVEIENFNYTLTFPKFLFKFYDKLDSLLPRIPIIKEFSIMLFVSGDKKK